MDKKQIFSSKGNRPLWQIVISSVFYTLAFILFAMFFFGYEFLPTRNKSFKLDISTIWLGVACILQGILFSSVKNIFFDLKNRKYKEQYRIGPFKVGSWKALPKIDYVSVFRQPKRDGNFVFEVNLWYKKNRHYTFYENPDPDSVFRMGESAANVLGIKLLDATEPNNYKWIEANDSTSK